MFGKLTNTASCRYFKLTVSRDFYILFYLVKKLDLL